MGEGEFALVRQELDTAFRQNQDFEYVGDHDLHAALAAAASLQRDGAAIRRYAPPAEELAIRYEHKLYQAVVCRAWGVADTLAGKYEQAQARFDQALALFNGLG